MMNTRGLLASVVLALLSGAGMGCGNGFSSPLVGTWTTAGTLGNFTVTETFDVNSDGSLSVTESASSPSCSGAYDFTGYSWAATGSSVTVSGTATCMGAVTCSNVTVGCANGMQALKPGSCTYTLSNSDDTLALTACSGPSNATLTRQN